MQGTWESLVGQAEQGPPWAAQELMHFCPGSPKPRVPAPGLTSCLATGGSGCVVWMLELVASGLPLLPWNCWLTEVSVAPALTLIPLWTEMQGEQESV